jgi:hypothetical protein
MNVQSRKIEKSNNFKIFGFTKSKGANQDTQIRPKSTLFEEEEP